MVCRRMPTRISGESGVEGRRTRFPDGAAAPFGPGRPGQKRGDPYALLSLAAQAVPAATTRPEPSAVAFDEDGKRLGVVFATTVRGGEWVIARPDHELHGQLGVAAALGRVVTRGAPKDDLLIVLSRSAVF